MVVAHWLKIRAGSPKVVGSKPGGVSVQNRRVADFKLHHRAFENAILSLKDTLACKKVNVNASSNAIQ